MITFYLQDTGLSISLLASLCWARKRRACKGKGQRDEVIWVLWPQISEYSTLTRRRRHYNQEIRKIEAWYALLAAVWNLVWSVHHAGKLCNWSICSSGWLTLWSRIVDSTARCASTWLDINCKLRCLWSLWWGSALIVEGLLSRGRKGKVYIWYCSCKKLHVLTSWLLVSSSETTPSSSAVDPIVRL